MAKELNKINVNLAFTADTSKAKAQMKELQETLNKIANTKINDNLDLKEAGEAAKQLSYHLGQAFNATTGNIDLSKLNHSLQKSSTNVAELSNKLLKAGTAGQQAFIGLAKSISTADYPMFKLNSKLSEMLTTLKNAARWQLSSSMLHGFMGAVNQAYGYVQDLNESLTNIRVVTGNNVEEMARFAEQANRAAKALGSTTTDYANASLIYYQQGLNEEEVLKRTEVTVKMANVAGKSASEVSDQLTAVWNNFAKTGDNLEYYADVMTALGAATASSTDEIAGGLEKFAAIADTIGLSYEYAASALATITSNTRQSEEVVGTALKTIFARIQGLNLGETLDDGTTLNKYSAALESVGIAIFDQAGELKNMDTILDEMGEKWNTLNAAQQTALAQTVAGVRQYNQLISLMENWNAGDSDSMMANLETAYNATGALQEQADIWGESWEAASNRVKTSAQGIYDSLLDDDLFINFNNVFADMLTGVEQVIDGVGGLKGVIISTASFFMAMLSNKIQPALTNFVLNVKAMFQSAQAQAAQLIGQTQGKISSEIATGNYSTGNKQQLLNASTLAEARARLTAVSKDLTEQEKMMYQTDISLIEIQTQKAQTIADEITILEEERNKIYQNLDVTKEKIIANQTYEDELKSLMETQSLWNDLLDEAYDYGTAKDQESMAEGYQESTEAIDRYIDFKLELNEVIQQTVQAIMDECDGQDYSNENFKEGQGILQAFTQQLEAMGSELKDTNKEFTPDEIDDYKRKLTLVSNTFESMKGITSQTKKQLAELFSQAKVSKDSKSFKEILNQIINKLKELKFDSEQLRQIGISLSPKEFNNYLNNLEQGAKKTEQLTAIQEELQKKMNLFNPTHMISGLERITSLAASFGSVAMMGNAISSLAQSLSNEDLSFGEKLSTFLTSISMLVPGTIAAFKGLKTVISGTAAETLIYDTLLKKYNLTQKEINGETGIYLALEKIVKEKDKEKIASKTAEIIVNSSLSKSLKTYNIEITKKEAATLKENIASKLREGASLKEAIAIELGTLRTKQSKNAIDAETAAKIADKTATDALNASTKALLGPIGLIIGVVTAAITVFTAYSKAQKKAMEERAEENKEKVNAIMERVDALKSEREAFDELMKAYENAKLNQDGTAEAQKAIAEATWDICEALGIEIDLLDRLQGKAEGYDTKVFEKGASEALNKIQEFKNSWSDLDKNYLVSYNDVVGTVNPDEDYFDYYQYMYEKNTIGKTGYNSNIVYAPEYGASLSDASDINFRELLKNYLFSDFEGKDKLDLSDENLYYESSQGALKFKEGTSGKEQYKIISDMVNSIGKQLSAYDQGESEIFKWYKQIVKAGEGTSTNFNDARTEIENQIFEYAKNQTQADKKMSYDQINTYEEYLEVRDQFVENLRQGYTKAELDIDYSGFTDSKEYLQSIAEEFLLAKDNIAKLEGIELISSKNFNLPKDELEKLYQEYKDVFKFDGSINFDEITSIEELEHILIHLQAKADANEIQAKINIVQEAKGDLKKGMSVSDYESFISESGIKWGEYDEYLGKEIISTGEFLNKAYEDQVQYLESIEYNYGQKQIELVDSALNDTKELISFYEERLKSIEDRVNAGEYVSEEEKIKAENLKKIIEKYENSDLQGYKDIIKNNIADITASFENTESLDDFYLKLQQIQESGYEVGNKEKGQVLVDLASNYENCAEEIEAFNLALYNNDENAMDTAVANLELAVSIGELSEKYDLNTKSVENYAERLYDSNKELDLSKRAAVDMAVASQRLDRGIGNVNDNLEDYKKILKDDNKLSAEYSETMDDLKGNLADIFNVADGNMFSDTFAEGLLDSEDFKKALDGDIEALERLRVSASIDIGDNIVKNLGDAAKETQEEYRNAAGEIVSVSFTVQDAWDYVSSILKDGFTLKEINDEKFVESLNQMIQASNMTKEEVQSLLGSMGVSAKIKTEYKEQETQVPTYYDYSIQEGEDEFRFTDGAGKEHISTQPIIRRMTVPGAPVTVKGFVPVHSIETTSGDTTSGGKIDYSQTFEKASPPQVSIGSTTTGKGSSSSKKNTGPSKSVKPERYKEINDKLDDVSNAYEKANKAVDRFYGPKQIAKMREANKELSKEISLLKIKQKQAKDYLDDDRKALEKASADLGLDVNIDNNDFITNYTDLMNQADQKLKEAYAKAGDTIDDEEQEVLDALEKKVEDFEAAIAQFDETRETLEDIENEVLDKTYERQDRNFEILNKELEIKIDIDDRALNKLEYYADKFSDNFYKLAETYALIFKGANGEGVDKIDLVKDKLAQYAGTVNDNGLVIYGDYMRKLESDHHYNLISQAQYVEGLKNAETNIRDALTELNGYDKEIFSAYENTLDEASSTIEDHVDHIEHLSGVFDHYLTLMEMFGKQKDYTVMNNFLGGKVDTIRDRLDIAKEYYETLKETNNAGEYWQKYQDALESGNEDDINWWKQQWDAEIDALDAAQEEMLSLTEEWAEARRAVIENHIAEAADALEKSLTNDYGFEFLNDEWDKMNTRQEEYLDNVNKVYETNKLMRTAQKALDETNNKVAKQKLKGFINETQHLQENTNLSKHELEIQQAKYDLLLAEIALEEAQNAKSVVRLSRDNEGNFGYVYTADQDKVADAQQAVDNKRNDLYNLTLEGQKEYMEKYLQASQEMYDELNVLQEDYLNGLITEDEFKIRSETIKKYYQGSFEFQNEMSALEQAYRNGEIKNEEEYNLKQQEILNKYQAEDLGILNQYLYLASVSNKLAKEEDKILQDKYNSESIEDEKAYNKEKEKLISTFASNSTGILGDFLSFYKGESEEVNNKVADHWENGLDFISHNTSDWVDDMDDYLNEVENGVNEWADTYEDANEDVGNALKDSSRATKDLTDESKDLKEQIQNKVIPAVQKEIKAVRDLTGEYGNQRAELLRLIETYENYLDKLGQTIDTESGKEEKSAETPLPTTTTDDKTPDANKAMEDNTTSSQNEKIKTAAENLLNRAHLGQIANQDTLGWEEAAKKNHYNAKAIAMVKKALNDSVVGYGTGYDYERAKELLKTYNPDSFDTGGYTGIWGPEGKLALLHEKEIVLNKDDTENLLKTVSFIRELVSMIDSQASMSSLFNMTATTGIMTGNAGMEQQITIYADFPDATDHNEIEMAFNTLLNTASQYANRK